MNRYETVFIINPNVEEAGIKELIQKFSDLINNAGKVENVEDIEVNNWELDNTYNDYPYCANITLSDDVTSDKLYKVIYSKVDYQSGNYAEFATLQNGSITIYTKVNTTITLEAKIITY